MTTYQPLILDSATLDTWKSADYRRFILGTTVEPGIRMLLQRRRKRPDWPYVDTKFNPNTGRDLPESSYHVVFTWFLGRGSEALQEHLLRLDEFDGLSADERREARDVLSLLVANMTDAITRIVQLNNGRCPFRVDRDLHAIDETGKRVEADNRITSAGDTFCAKGMVATARPDKVRQGADMLRRTIQCIRANRYGVDQFKEQPRDISQGSRMVTLGATGLFDRPSIDRTLRAEMLAVAEEFLTHVLDKHYDPQTALFSEYIDVNTSARASYLDPGHATEFVGLGLGAAACLKADTASLNPARRDLLLRLDREMPRLLSKTFELGWNARHPGLFKAVDTQTGRILNDDMPWWNIPETMRAAARCHAIAADDSTRQRCLEIWRLCHNAYFTQYPNPACMLFPFQTISGTTGQVVDKVPAVPEGDPLYHTNLALLEMLDVVF